MALACAVVFVAIVVVRLPVDWVIPSAATKSCTSIEGSLWTGSCTGLVLNGASVGDVTWELEPLRLLLGRLALHVNVARGPATGSADVEVGVGGRIAARHVLADFPLDGGMLPGIPRSLHGHAHVDLPFAEVRHGVITQLEGRIEAHDLEDRSGADTPLGSYLLVFPAGGRSGQPTGKLRDVDGPLALEGTLKLTPQPGFMVEGLIAPRPGAPPELVNNIRFLGSPDAAGRRPFSMAGTF
jgi:general secretion pathway protein N